MALTLSQRYWAGIVTYKFGGKTFKCSRRTRSALYRAAKKLKESHPGAWIEVFQGCFQDPRAVPASKGTHDFDAVLDVWVHGLSGAEAQRFFRWQGWAAFFRTRAQGPWVDHIHMALLPPIAYAHPTARQVGEAYKRRGLKVGRFIDGGLTSQGVTNATSQVADYMADPPRNALAGHAIDRSWHPPSIIRTIFRPKGY